METFIIGCLTTIVGIGILNKSKNKNRKRHIFMRQSTFYKVIKSVSPDTIKLMTTRKTQSQVHRSKNVVRVLQTSDNKAYWVKDNIFYYADVVNGEFDPTAGIPVDTTDISKNDLDKLLLILDNLKNG